MIWDVLEEIGSRDGMTTNQLITKLYDELTEHETKSRACTPLRTAHPQTREHFRLGASTCSKHPI
jgi:predicted DNA-binding ribbon-helix-helix protein